jgi:transcriptional regulator with XRE-family HTH domain
MARSTPSARFGARVRAMRKARGWSQAKLAEVVGLSANHVGVIERGEKTPTLDTVQAFAKVYGTTLSTMFGETEDPKLTGWLGQVHALAAAVPPAQRQLVTAILGAFVRQGDAEEPVRRAPGATMRLHEREPR